LVTAIPPEAGEAGHCDPPTAEKQKAAIANPVKSLRTE